MSSAQASPITASTGPASTGLASTVPASTASASTASASTASASTGPAEPDLPLVVTSLLKGVVYRDTNDRVWRQLLVLQAQVRDYVAVIGLTVVIDDSEGYAFLRSRPEDPDADPNHPAPPRLIARRSLSFHVSLLLALLRKKLAESDARTSDTRLMLTRDQIAEMVRLFLPSTSNEARLVDQIDTYIAKAVDLGFLRQVRGQDALYEVRRILKAFVDGQWLADFDQRLAEYAAQLDGPAPDGPTPDGPAPDGGQDPAPDGEGTP